MTKTIDRGALAITLGLAATVLAGCGQNGDWRVCQDSQGRRALDANCGRGGGHGGGFAWVFLGGMRAPAVGERINGASSSPRAGVSYGAAPAEGGVARGGFGATGEGHGGGEAAGHGGAGE